MTNTLSPDTTFDIVTAPNRDSLHWTPGQVTWSTLLEWMEHPALTKACGNYMLGSLHQTTVTHRKGATPCHNYHRTKLAVDHRSAITLDVDHPAPGFMADTVMLLDHAAIVHTTFSSTKEEPRYRIIVPLDRNVAPDEYHTAASALMQLLGESNFDPGSVQPERYMFLPSESKRGLFQHWVLPGDPAKADELLAGFQQDLSSLPTPKPNRTKRDPFALEGTIGAFNRAYADFGVLIEEYDLPYTSVGSDRWQLTGATAAAGMGEVADGLVFSHHANDPAYGQTCSAFDLARLHLFGHLDEDVAPGTPVNRLPSNKAMAETATQDLRVVRELVGDDFEADMAGTADAIQADNWKLGFSLDARTGTPRDTIGNWDLIVRNDPAFKALRFNELSMAIEAGGDLPWRPVTDRTATFDSGDRASLALWIEREYNIRPGRAYLDDLVSDKARASKVNPVADYLRTLKWDGTPRVETCLPGVRPTTYTRLVARKAMTAAVARMLEPGIKWDHMVVLFGNEGLGKSYWVDKLAKGYSASLGRIGDKDTLLVMQRSWIMTSDEGHAMRKADFDAQKEFITRSSDVFRLPYEREAQVHPRHCVIWGTTNEEAFLRKQEGNRRFLIVRCEDKVDFDLLTDHYIDQVWAEALHLYEAGEKLWLDDQESALASVEREDFTEETPMAGLIQTYADTPVPLNWYAMSPEARSLWLQSAADGFEAGTETITHVSTLQVWVEALGRRRGEHKRADLLEIANVLKNMPGWESGGNRHIPGYGTQKVWVRTPQAAAAQDFSDLL